jgi:hypothetical protein
LETGGWPEAAYIAVEAQHEARAEAETSESDGAEVPSEAS